MLFECLAAVDPCPGKGHAPGEKYCKKKLNEELEALSNLSEDCSHQASKDADRKVSAWASEDKDHEVSIQQGC